MSKYIPWNEIEADPEFQQAPQQSRRTARKNYFEIVNMGEKTYKDADEKGRNNQYDTWMKDYPKQEINQGRTALGTTKDVGVTAMHAGLDVVESGVGLLNMSSGGELSPYIEKSGFKPKETHEKIDKLYSPAQKYANKQVSNAEGFVDTAVEHIKYPSTIVHGIERSIPSMIAGRGAVTALSKVAPKIMGTAKGKIIGYGAGEGSVVMGQTAEGIRQESGDLTGKNILQSMGAGITTGAITAASGGLAKKFGFADIDNIMAGVVDKAGVKMSKGQIVKGMLAGGVTEGAFEELPQSAQEQMWMNVALGRDLLEGVPEAAASGLMIGGPMGGAVNLHRGMKSGDGIKKRVTEKKIIEERNRVYAETKKTNLESLKRKNLSDEALLDLVSKPEALKEWAIEPADISKILESRTITKEAQEFAELLESAPNDAIKAGIASEANVESIEKTADLEELSEKEEQQAGQTKTKIEEGKESVAQDDQDVGGVNTEVRDPAGELDNQIQQLNMQHYDMSRKGEDTTELEAQIADLETQKESMPAMVQESTKSVEQMGFDLEELYEDAYKAEMDGNEEAFNMIDEQILEIEAQQQIAEVRTAAAKEEGIEAEALEAERQLAMKEVEIAEKETDIANLLADKSVGPQGKTQRAAKVETYRQQQIMAYFAQAQSIPLANRNLESLRTEYKFWVQNSPQSTDPQAVAEFEEKTGLDSTELQKRIIKMGKTLRSGSKQATVENIENKNANAQASETDSKKTSLESSKSVKALETDVATIQGKIDKAVKGKKKVKHLRAQLVEAQKNLDIANRDALASNIESRNTLKSNAADVTSELLNTLGLKKVPSIFEIVASYDDLPAEVKKAYEQTEQALASLQGPKWTSALITDFIKAPGSPKKASADKWIALLKAWTTDVPKLERGKPVMKDGKPVLEDKTIIGKGGKSRTIQVPKLGPATEAVNSAGNKILTMGKMPVPVRDEIEFSGLVEFLENSESIEITQEAIITYLEQSGLHLLDQIRGYDHIFEENQGLEPEDEIQRQHIEDRMNDALQSIDTQLAARFPNANATNLHRLRAQMMEDPQRYNHFRNLVQDIARSDGVTYGATDPNFLDSDIEKAREEYYELQDEMDEFMTDRQEFNERERGEWSHMVLRTTNGAQYREVVLNLPPEMRDEYGVRLKTDRIGSNVVQAKFSAIEAAILEIERLDEEAEELGVDNPGYEIVKENKVDKNKNFHSPHGFGINNIVHVRADIRESDKGDTLFINELQSDWHQRARKNIAKGGPGYKGVNHWQDLSDTREQYHNTIREIRKHLKESKADKTALKARYDALGKNWRGYNSLVRRAIENSTVVVNKPDKLDLDGLVGEAIRDSGMPYSQTIRDFTYDRIVEIYPIYERAYALKQKEHALEDAVADAPFKSNWIKMTMKRMVMQAVIEGKKTVSWPSTPEQIAQIESYGEVASEDHAGRLVNLPDGRWLVLQNSTTRQTVESSIADNSKWLDETPHQDVTPIIERYTNRMPKMMDTWLKQYNSKVEKIYLTDDLISKSNLVEEVNGFKITPELKQAAENGLPMNSIKETKPAGIYHKGKMYLIADNIDPDQDMKGLVIHESGHWLRRNDPIYEKRYNELLTQVKKIYSQQTPEGEAMRAATKKAFDANSTRLSNDLIQEEAVMYFLQDQANVDLPFYKKIVSFVKQFLYKHFGVSPANLNMSGYDMGQVIVADIRTNIKTRDTKSKELESSLDEKKPKDATLASDREMLRDLFTTKLTEAEAKMFNDFKRYTSDTYEAGTKSKNKVIAKISEIFTRADKRGVAFSRDKNTQTSGWLARLLSSPEYTFTKDAAGAKIVAAAENADEIKFKIQNELLEGFPELAEAFKKYSAVSYDQAAAYLNEVGRTGKGFRLKQMGDKWIVQNPKGVKIYEDEHREATAEALIAAEQVHLKNHVDKDAREFIKLFRELMDRSLEAQNMDLQGQIDNAERYNLAEPNVGDQDSPTLSEAIAASGDLQGTYFPRIRLNKQYYIRMEKAGSDPILFTADMVAITDETSSPLVNTIKEKFNKVSPAGREIAKHEANGYTVTEVEPGQAPSEVIFDVPGLLSSMDALMGLAEDSTKAEETAAMQKLNDILTQKISDIYKVKGNMSSRAHRSKTHTEGYELDPIKAAVSHAQRVAAGIAKRHTAREMLLAFTGRDQSFDEFVKENPGSTKSDYKAAVAERKIDPRYQKELYADLRTYMQHMLKPNTRAQRVMGYLKAATVVKFLGFRVSSAAINMTNMVAAVPATIAAHTGLDITDSFKLVGEAASKYYAYRSRRPTFEHYKQDLKDKALFNTKKKVKAFGEAVTTNVELTDEEHQIFVDISARGWDEAHFNIDATRAVQDYAGEKYNAFIASSMYMFGAAERANRAMTIFASYKAHQIQNPDAKHEDLLEMAHHTSDRAHGSYGKATKPWLVQKYPILDMAFMFMKFQHNYILNMVEQGVKYKNAKAALHMIAAPSIIAGMGASILASPTLALLQVMGFGGDDPEEEFYAWAERTFPDWVASSARHGIAGMLGVNFKGSMQSPIGDIYKLKDAKLTDIGGAPAGALLDMFEAAKYASFGEWQKAIEKALPSAFAGPIKAQRLGDEGYTTGGYAPVFYSNKQLKATPAEQMLMSLSFNPARPSGLREKQWHEKLTKKTFKTDRDKINRLMRKYTLKHGSLNQLQLNEVDALLTEYNYRVTKSNPTLNEKFLTWPKLVRSLKQSMYPSKYERTR